MENETYERLQKLLDQMWEHVVPAAGFSDYQEYMTALRQKVRDNPAFGPFLHGEARQLYPANPSDTIPVDKLYEIFGLIDDREKAAAALRSLPEDAAPEAEKALQWVIKVFLPAIRSNATTVVKHLPQRRAGGAPSKMPKEEECRQICNEISELHKRGVLLGSAQQRAANKRGLSLRMIHKIWAQRASHIEKSQDSAMSE